MPLVVGVMSGTSLDGIDCALVDFDQFASPTLIAHHYHPYSDALRHLLADTIAASDLNVDQLGALDVELGELIAASVNELIETAKIDRKSVLAIGSHGHTLRHRPQLNFPFTWQIGDPNVIAERTGITTVADFRRRDIAAGGQGAPLVPAFHESVFSSAEQARVVLNIGGIANVTILPSKNSGADVFGFDTGPGNALLNDWIQRHQNSAFDENGDWAKSGICNSELLNHLMKNDYFSRSFPKSCGREQFNLNWLEECLFHFENLRACDIQATLVELTASTVADAIHAQQFNAEEIFVCGGGAHNQYLMSRLAALTGMKLNKTDSLGVPADWVEAMAFAWLAWQTMNNLPGNIPSVTGAKRATILGAIYPA